MKTYCPHNPEILISFYLCHIAAEAFLNFFYIEPVSVNKTSEFYFYYFGRMGPVFVYLVVITQKKDQV
jgi:hypothetical protein